MRAEGVGGVEQDRGEVVDSEVAGDGELSHGVEQKPEQVVEDGGDRAPVGNRWGADMAGIEAVVGVDAVCVASDAQLVAVRVSRSATKAVGVVRRQVDVFGRRHSEGTDPVLGLERFGAGGLGCVGVGCVLGHGRLP